MTCSPGERASRSGLTRKAKHWHWLCYKCRSPDQTTAPPCCARRGRAMSDALVLYSSQPAAVILTLNRPDKRNALSRGLIAALTDAFLRAREDTAARCVILTGAGPVFCAGMDLAELAESFDLPETPAAETTIWNDALRLANLFDLIYTLSKPTIAAVNGAAAAGGAGLVTVRDLAAAVPEARIGYPDV